MRREEALEALHRIVHGIDREEIENEGWWETSTGAEFGAERLWLLEDLVITLTE